MRTALLFLGFALLLLAPDLFADPAEKPPENIIKHFEWCAVPKGSAERLSRYQGFWSRYHPKDEEYQDAIHGTFVRHCAYRLAALYAATNNPEKCREMLDWLETHDQALPQLPQRLT